MSTVVVTGVAGAVGRRVAQRFAGAGVAVVGIDTAEDPALPGVAYHRMDLAAPAAAGELSVLVEGAEAVVHLAWQTGDTPGAAGPAAGINRTALERVLDAAGAAGVAAVVHLSSATVYGAWPDNPVPLSEDAPLRPNPGFAFAAGKADAERVVADWAAKHPDVRVAVLRPAVTVGCPERPLYLALGATRVPGADDGARPVQYLHVDDLAGAVIFAIDRQLRGVFNVAPDAGIGEGLARSISGGVANFTLPPRVARPLAAWGWDLWRRGVPREARAYTVHPWVVAPDRLLGAGWEPQYSSAEALVATDDRPHLDDLPPGRRQNLTLALAAAGVALVAGATAGGVVWARRRSGRRRSQAGRVVADLRRRYWPA